jgi:hypothetical protein
VTTIDNTRGPGTLAGQLPGRTLDRLDELARLTGISHAGIAALAIDAYRPAISTPAGEVAPPVDAVLVTNATETIHRLKVAQATVPAGGPTCRAMRDALSIIELLLAKFAPPVDAGNMTPGSPGDGRGAGGVAATPAPVSAAAPAHVHLGGGPCVYGERCGQ